ncbi:30S ribosome-binding factor RbfA [Candidatus Pantoea carbekii]|nr:30S ribosome-binding factor RbfA [Candidatus Pantoea carbekii]
MEKEFSRRQRVAQELHKKIAFILQRKIRDPRLRIMITVSGVEISRDLSYAKIFITCLNEENHKDIQDTVNALKEASSYIRMLLSKIIKLRTVPKLTFFYDPSLTQARYMLTLISNTIKNDMIQCSSRASSRNEGGSM